ncbi:PqqD family protein [bacterium]|nr:PqqD family protein [bacterium]
MPLPDLYASLMGLFHRRKGGQPTLTREQSMAARPVRNPGLEWSLNEDDEAVVTIPRRKDTQGRFLAWMFFIPEARPLSLDAVGTFVWEHCDGEKSVSDLIDLMAKEYNVARKEVEVSLIEYLKRLGQRGMVGFLVPREIARELGQEGKELVGLEDVGESASDLKAAQEAAEQKRKEAQSAAGKAHDEDEPAGDEAQPKDDEEQA